MLVGLGIVFFALGSWSPATDPCWIETTSCLKRCIHAYWLKKAHEWKHPKDGQCMSMLYHLYIYIWIDGWYQPQKWWWLGDVLLLLQSPFECSHRFPQKEKFIHRNHVKTCKNHILSSRSSFEFSSEFYSYRWTKAGVSERLESLKSNVLSKRKLSTRLELVNS